jgi:hypothetical protein
MPSATKKKTSSQRKRRSGRSPLHPEHLLGLFKRAGLVTRLLTVVLLLFTLLGMLYLVVPFTVDIDHPQPPPLTLRMSCPPPVVSAVAGAGGLPNPLPAVEQMGEVHDDLCGGFGRQRGLTGLLMTAAGLLNTAALLEWARIRRRARRRTRRRSRRREGRSSTSSAVASRPSAGRTSAGSSPPPAQDLQTQPTTGVADHDVEVTTDDR